MFFTTCGIHVLMNICDSTHQYRSCVLTDFPVKTGTSGLLAGVFKLLRARISLADIPA